MKLPQKSAAFAHRVAFSVYVERRLRREGLETLADEAASLRSTLTRLGRSWEDADVPIQEALADRDATDDALDTLAQLIRLTLAARSVDATEKAPYTQIFPDALRYYTQAPLDAQTARYGELKLRLEANLPAGDPLLAQTQSLDALLATWDAQVSALETARTQERMLRDQLDATSAEWDSLMERVYGTLVAEKGRKDAERFFP